MHSLQQTCVASNELSEQEAIEEINHLARFFADEYLKNKPGYICWRLFIPKAKAYYNLIRNPQ